MNTYISLTTPVFSPCFPLSPGQWSERRQLQLRPRPRKCGGFLAGKTWGSLDLYSITFKWGLLYTWKMGMFTDFFFRNFDKHCEDISCGYVKKHYCMFPTCIYRELYPSWLVFIPLLSYISQVKKCWLLVAKQIPMFLGPIPPIF